MSVVKINAIHVPAGSGSELEKRFAARKHSVDGAKGFEGFQLLRPVKGDERYFVVTTWDSEESFQEWSANGAKAAHGRGGATSGPAAGGAAPADAASASAAPAHENAAPDHAASADSAEGDQVTPPKPVATGADLLEFEVVEL